MQTELTGQQVAVQSTPDHGADLRSVCRDRDLEDGIISVKHPGVHNINLAWVTHLLGCSEANHVSTKHKVDNIGLIEDIMKTASTQNY